MKCKEILAKELLQRYLCTMTDDSSEIPTPRELDSEALKALSHPLRVRLFNELATYGAATASGLAERVGESSGATSYHLRQLERHGFVREVEGRGTARERWWERVPGMIRISPPGNDATPSEREVALAVSRQFGRVKAIALQDYIERGDEMLPDAWTDVATLNESHLTLTLEQFTELNRVAEEFVMAYAERFRGQNLPGARPILVQLNIFPALDRPTSEER
jgi:DNA-binding transcriptional ArsR family regulator